jgi:hypothetical protein
MTHKKSPPRFPKGGYDCEMEFTDYLIIKAVVVLVAAAIYGFWKGLTGR